MVKQNIEKEKKRIVKALIGAVGFALLGATLQVFAFAIENGSFLF